MNTELARAPAVKINREQLFSLGVVLGTALGLVLGSAIALWIGDAAVDTIRRTVDRVSGRDDGPRFEVLLQ
jgi:putative Ca2+/H+ antiporter (TMEM165/GDT1 family)